LLNSIFFIHTLSASIYHPHKVKLINPLMPNVHGTAATKHPVPDWVKTSFVIFDIRALWRSALSVRVPGCQKLQITA